MKTKKRYLILLIALLIAGFNVNAAIFTVNNNLDTDNGLADNSPAGSNTLRKCIRLANAIPGSTINFALPNAINTITCTDINVLNVTANGTIIDGFSNPGAVANTTAFGGTLNPTYRIKITSLHNNPGFDVCLQISGSNCVVKGLVFWEFGNDNDDSDDPSVRDIAVTISGNGNSLEGCFIGCNETSAYLSGSFYQSVGVLVTGSNNKIGGTTVAGKNLISGNTYAGVIISGASATGNKVVGNYIGAFQKDGRSPIINNLWIAYNPAGLISLADSVQGRQQYGVRIVGANSNIIGDTTSAGYDGRNCISMNINAGVAISGGASTNVLKSNIIGLAPDGNTQLNRGEPLPPITMGRKSEQLIGVQLGDQFTKFNYNGAAVGNTIGGFTANARNIIAGNANSDNFPSYYVSLNMKSAGIFFAHAGTMNNTVRGNYIGTNSTGTAEPNLSADGYLYEQANGIATSPLASGGNNSITNNLISGNSNGIDLFAGGFIIRGNTIGAQAGGMNGIAPQNSNQGNGITLESTCTQKCIIGGTTTAQRNLISGNSQRGIYIVHNAPAAHRIIGNYIGTNINGTAALVMAAANQVNGIEIGTSTMNATGDSIVSNVISYNSNRGIKIGNTSGTNYIFGNTIGLQSNGTAAGTTQQTGVEIVGAAVTNIQVGGSVAGQGNIISGNTTNGILLNTTGATTNLRILGNTIGATSALANPTGNSQDYGIVAAGGSSFSASRIGGTSSGEGNTITLNTLGGILLNNANNNIIISRNLIYSNPAGVSSSSINLNGLANGNRVAPVITTATTTTISGTCTVAGDIIQVFKNVSGGANCQDMNVYLGTATAVGNNWSLTIGSVAGDKVVATASNTSVTSGVSACGTVVPVGGGVTLTLTALIQGFYNGSTMVSDVVTVELRNTTSPYTLVSSATGTLNTAGTGTINFSGGASGVNYYIVVKHRNSIQTWSTPTPFTGGTLAYNFTTAANKAFGSNMILKSGKWCIYSGDVNQDGTVDLNDMTPIDNDAFNFVSGPNLATDLNGDQTVDLNDMTIVDNNAFNFISVVKP